MRDLVIAFVINLSNSLFVHCRSRIRPATGGINKSTKDCVKSPHYYLHEQAAQLAIKATEDFLLSIRDVVGDDKFLQFFSLGTTTGGSSLCFVVDQSGSMGDDIVAVRERAKQIVQSSSKPYNYVLVQFNDNDQNPGMHLTNTVPIACSVTYFLAFHLCSIWATHCHSRSRLVSQSLG